MSRLLDRLARAGTGQALVLVILVAALFSYGANSAAAAALLSTILLALLSAAIALAPARTLGGALKDNWLSVLAALIFFAWWGVRARPDLAGGLPQPLFAVSLSPYRTIEGLAAFAAPCAAYLIGALAGRGRDGRDQTGRWFSAACLAFAFGALIVFFYAGGRSQGRLDGGVSSANAAATTFAMFALLALTLIWRAARNRLQSGRALTLPSSLAWAQGPARAPLSAAAALMAIACLLLTASRGGLVAGAAAFAFLILALAGSSMKAGIGRASFVSGGFAALAAAIALLFFRGGGAVLERFALTQDDWRIRQQLADAHFARFLEHPLAGAGLNTFHELNVIAATPENWRALHPAGSAHNIFIQTLEEGGLVGLGLFALMLALPLARALWRLFGARSGADWAAAMLAVTVLVLLHGAVDFSLQAPAIAALYAFALGAFLGRAETEGRR